MVLRKHVLVIIVKNLTNISETVDIDVDLLQRFRHLQSL